MAPCVGERLVEDQLTEIPVGNHQNALLLAGKGDRKRDQVSATYRGHSQSFDCYC